ncbi:MAG: GNAT family N-acetyltransferase [Actinobacteria bacterium]|nr:GNAT family N-acetyltransferase [Actinomycetota bacterium]
MAWRLLTDLPDVTGLSFRGFGGPDDFPGMVEVLNAACAADEIDRFETVDQMERNYRHLDHCDPETDMVLAEIDGRVVAYARVTWWDEAGGPRRLMPFCFVHPDVRGKGIGSAMLAHNEARLREIDAGLPQDRERTLFVIHAQTETAAEALYTATGYVPNDYQADMVRPDLEDLPDAPLPDGLEVRTPGDGEMRKVWEAAVEAFRDHVGFSEPTEADFEYFLDSPHRDPSLWRVAWDGDEVAGQVRSFINPAENEEMRHKRGYTEDISVRRPYRRRGLARALLVQSLQAVKDRGMEEAALGVHTGNTDRAFDLYESVGFRVVRLWTSRVKPLEP